MAPLSGAFSDPQQMAFAPHFTHRSRPSERNARSWNVSTLDLAVSISVAFAFAVAQPLFDLLGRGADFFVARRSSPIDPVILAFGLAILAPALCGALILVARRIGPRIAFSLHAVVLGALIALFLLQLLKGAPALRSISGVLLIAASLLLGALGVAAFYRLRGGRLFFRVVSPVILIFPALFLFASPVQSVVFPASASRESAAGGLRHPTPIAMVLFDEMPVSSLMDTRGHIDKSLYPNFARLASEGTWFRNATASHSHTVGSVPEMLTGRRFKAGATASPSGSCGAPGSTCLLPVLSNYPNNLFTFLGRDYDIRAFETYTDLCPRSLCRSLAQSPESFLPRWYSLLADLRIAAFHVFLPDDLTRDLPAVDETFGNFEARGEPDGDTEPRGDQRKGFGKTVAERDALVDKFLASVGSSARPPLFYLHLLMPHRPFYYLPTGQKYKCDSRAGRKGGGWGPSAWAVTHQYQRHLLQVGYADRILGSLVDRLKRAGLYKETLIVVASDHGMIFRPNVSHTRMLRRDTLPWIAPVPLFIKAPGHQGRRGIDDRPVELIDVLPTIADTVGARLPWQVDGRSVFRARAARRTREIFSADLGRRLSFPTAGREKYEILARKRRLFGEALFSAAPDGYSNLIGRSMSDLRVRGYAAPSARVNRREELRNVKPHAKVIPTCVSGRLHPPPSGAANIAVVLNGVVRAVTQTYEDGKFAALVPPERLRRGSNELRLVHLSRGETALKELRIR